MKWLLYLIIIIFVIPQIFSQDYTKYDKYGCIAEKILNECKDKRILIRYMEEFRFSNQISYEMLKKSLIDVENYLLESKEGKLDILNYYDVVRCVNITKGDYNETKDILQFYTDHFLWRGKSIDCAWIRNDYKIDIDKIEFNGKCPTLIIGDKNSLVKDCSDTTINLSIKEIVFSLGGITLFGISITYLIKFLIKKSKKSKAPKN